MTRVSTSICVLAWFALAATPVLAADIGANLRGGGFASRIDGENAAQGFLNGRATIESDIGGGVEFEGHIFGTARVLSDPADALIPDRVGHGQYRAFDLLTDNGSGKDGQVLAFVDRFVFRKSFGDVDVSIGRQAVTFGKAYFWNPLDVFRPFAAEQVNRDYKAGVDAVRLDWELDSFSGITVVSVLGQEVDPLGAPIGRDREANADTYGSALIGRYATYVDGWDIALQGGKVYGGLQIGAAAVGEISVVQVRLEGAYFDARRVPQGPALTVRDSVRQLFTDHFQAVFGAGYRWPNTLQIDGEYFYNGAGVPDDQLAGLFRVAVGASQQINRHLVGLRSSYEITPILIGNLTAIHGVSDDSGLVQGQLVWSLSDETDFLFTGSAGYGRQPLAGPLTFPRSLTRIPQSEFGALRGALAVELRTYF